MRFVWGFLWILSLTVWLLPLAERGLISPSHAAIALVGLVLFVALMGVGGGIGHIIRLTFRVGIPVASPFTFAIVHGYDLEGIAGILLQLAPVLVALIGIYLMVAGPLMKKR